MFLKSSFNYINEFYFIFKNQIRKFYLNSSIYNRKISRVDENVLVYQPSLNILSSLIKYEKQKKKIEDFNVQSIWENKGLKYNDFKKLHSFYWLFSIDLKSSNEVTQTIINNWILRVRININNRSKINVDTQQFTLPCNLNPHIINQVCVFNSAKSHLPRKAQR